MILIFSINDDYSTSRVINWLIHLKKEFIRINENTDINIISLTEKNFIISIDGITFYSDKITKIWYRRGDINLFKQHTSQLIKKYLSIESASLSEYMRYSFDKIESINNFETRDINKLYLLDLCKKNNILVPRFIVTSEKEILFGFYNEENNIISKPLNMPFSIIDASHSIHQAYTAEILINDINQLPDKFIPTFFQKNIIKEYEIRCFYLNGKFYAMAIFSQKNKNTNVDFRNYDNLKPNRVTPYQFPKSYEKKIKNLLDKIGLNCASFDVVVSKEDRQYYFLDLNPIGQFGMVSDPCNYNLEKEIALHL
ncbi:grasp-with-spasm system ATP-grasp peptide maturase [Pedobacter changchengzhani]|uniref:Grasp-with-spasm system ATP-grasp peptide maturase n=1 Tax=Pedobacter changchengzhani TaxID=2529274 RepID=A0A4R5MJE7_9SPHI|nr:grasp-with-spasm system ATP-grasp peptide maturase [Pedobacter changchengzhani]TDG35652.1 grasp-with-spasm system ATP-grasp peptide maturase [Pedobacter changchengzhani]